MTTTPINRPRWWLKTCPSQVNELPNGDPRTGPDGAGNVAGVRLAVGPNQLSAAPGKLRVVDWWEAIWTGVVVGLVVAAVIAGVHWYLGRRETKATETKERREARIPLRAGALQVVPEIRTNAEVAKRCEEGYHVSAEATFVSLTQWKDFKNQIAGLQAEDPELWRELEETYGALERTKARAAQPPQSVYLLTLADRLENAAERNG